MSNEIERIENKRLRYLKWYIFGFAIFIILMLVRHFFRLGGLNDQLIGSFVLAGLVISLIIQAVFVLLSALLNKEIQSDPHLEAALHNELVRSITLQSWIAAYIGASVMTLIFAFSSYFYPVCDPMTISLCSIAMGAGAHQIYFYIRYKTL